MNLTKRGILLDKDGTLIEYNDLWIRAVYAMVTELGKKYETTELFDEKIIYQQLGIQKSLVSDASPLGTGTTKQITEVLHLYFVVEQKELLSFVQNFFYQFTVAHKEELISIGNLPKLLNQLKEAGYSLGVVTSDDYESTMFTLELLKINTYFDVIVTGDRFPPKPEKEGLEYASQTMDILSENILFVGDSTIDARFSNHCRLGVGVTSGVATRDELLRETPHIYTTIHDVPYNQLFNL